MTHSALPDNWEELIADYVLGNLDPHEFEEFNRLLTTHPQVVTEVAQLQEVLHLIPYGVVEQPPDHLLSTLLKAAQDSSNETVRSKTAEGAAAPVRSIQRSAQKISQRSRWLGLTSTVAAAAALMALLLGVDNYRLRQELQNTRVVTQALQQPQTVIKTLTGNENAAGRVVIDVTQQQLVVIVQDLPPLPQGQVYRLWASADQTVNYWGQFGTSSTGTALTQLTIPASRPNLSSIKLLITVESSASPPTPQGPVVMQSSL